MRKLYELTIEELKRKQKFQWRLNLIALVFGTAYVFVGMWNYERTGLIFSPMVLVIAGVVLLLLSALPSNIELFIYLKSKEINL
jgi:hypothetical protein